MKVCNKCLENKDFIFFPKRKDSKDGYRNTCKLCIKKDQEIYYLNNKEVLLEKKKEYYINNKDFIQSKNKNYYADNKENLLIYSKEYRSKNKDLISKRQKEYHINNKEKRNKYNIEYLRNRINNDNIFKAKHYIKSMIRSSLRLLGYSKKSKTEEILGCSYEDFILYLESRFESWMTWENRGLYNGELNYGWDIDHIIPLSSAETEEDIIRLNHYTNLQPLCSKVNRYIKRDKIKEY